VVLLCILSSFLYAFYAAFRYDADGGPINKLKSELSDDQIGYFNTIQAIVEGIFLIDMMIEFVLEFHDDATNTDVRDISIISKRYLKNEFLSDFIPLIPFNWIGIFKFKHSRIFFLVKCFRLKETFAILDTAKIMKHVKRFYANKLNKIVDNPELAENIYIDQNKIMNIIIISYLIKTIKLVILIFLVSYFLGICFYIFCDITRDTASVKAAHDDFILKFEFKNKTNV
jgi:hypothetical protein